MDAGYQRAASVGAVPSPTEQEQPETLSRSQTLPGDLQFNENVADLELTSDEELCELLPEHRAITLPSFSAKELMQLFPSQDDSFEPGQPMATYGVYESK